MIINKLLIAYPEVNNKYFIHVRRGTFVDGSQKYYKIDYDTYFKLAIKYILSIDPNAQFCVVSDDIPFCKEYHLFQSDNFIIMENLDTIDTLHFMSMCTLGGIWMNNSNTFDVWPEGTVIIEYQNPGTSGKT